MATPMRRVEIAEIEHIVEDASDEAVHLAATVLRDDVANQRWRSQLGPCLTQSAVARLLGITPQAVAKRAAAGELLRLTHRDGRPVYPTFQFRGRGVLTGLGRVLSTLLPVDDHLTVASWLTSPKRSLGGRTPVEALRSGDAEQVWLAACDYMTRSS